MNASKSQGQAVAAPASHRIVWLVHTSGLGLRRQATTARATRSED
jgi:hypothetical protein